MNLTRILSMTSAVVITTSAYSLAMVFGFVPKLLAGMIGLGSPVHLLFSMSGLFVGFALYTIACKQLHVWPMEEPIQNAHILPKWLPLNNNHLLNNMLIASKEIVVETFFTAKSLYLACRNLPVGERAAPVFASTAKEKASDTTPSVTKKQESENRTGSAVLTYLYNKAISYGPILLNQGIQGIKKAYQFTRP